MTPRPETGYADYRDRVAGSFGRFYAEGRDRWTADPVAESITDFIVSAVAAAGPVDGTTTLLDVGCGRGHQAARLAERLAADVTGIDLLAVVDAPEPTRGSVRWRTTDFLSFGAAGEQFDVLVDNGCLHHQRPEDWARWIAHGRSLCAPGARWVVCSFLSPTGEVTYHPGDDGRQNVWFTPAAVRDLFAGGGFALLDEIVLDRHFHALGHDLHYLVQVFAEEG
jgi:cyclopropane fatty-acyl-phospholipid synthase-like methyltransferase